MDNTQIEKIAQRAAEKAIKSVLRELGIDSDDALTTQRLNASLREIHATFEDPNFQADLMCLRRWRKAMDSVQMKGLLTVVTIIAASGLAAIWLGLQAVMSK